MAQSIASGADGPREPAQGKDLLKMLKDMLKMLKDLLIVSGADGPREPAQDNKAEMNKFTGSMYKATFTIMLLAVTLIFINLTSNSLQQRANPEHAVEHANGSLPWNLSAHNELCVFSCFSRLSVAKIRTSIGHPILEKNALDPLQFLDIQGRLFQTGIEHQPGPPWMTVSPVTPGTHSRGATTFGSARPEAGVGNPVRETIGRRMPAGKSVGPLYL